MCSALWASGLWLRYATLQNLLSGNTGSRHTVASAGDDGATTAGPELGPLAGHTDLVKSVDLSSNLLVSGSWDGGIRLWLRTPQNGREAGFCLGSSYHHQGGNSIP